MILLLLLACTPKPDTGVTPWTDWAPPEGTWPYTGPDRLLVLEADTTMEAGAYGVLDPGGAWVQEGSQSAADAVGACAGPWLLIVNRFLADNLQFVDPTSGATVAQYSTGNGTNPHGAVFVGAEAWIPLYETPYVLVADWATGAEIARVDLSAWADADGIPEVDALFGADDLLWASLQRMDRSTWRPAGGSVLLGIDPTTREVVTEIPLPLDNPTGGWTVVDDVAWSGAIGAYETDDALALDGGVLAVDLAIGTASTILSEAEVGRNVYAVLSDGSHLWLSTYDESSTNHIEVWEGTPWARTTEILTGYYAGWSRAADGTVWVADNTGARVLHAAWQDGTNLGDWPTVLRPTDLVSCKPSPD